MPNIKQNYSLKSHNTFNIAAKTKYFVECNSIEELQQAVKQSETGFGPRLIVGSGSNILFKDDYNGLIIHPNIKGKKLLKETHSSIQIKVSCGENWDDFVEYCVENSYGGLENLSWIPGKVGAVPIQNIGAYGVEAKDCIIEVEALNITSGEIKTFTKDECEFGYRNSIFKNEYRSKYIILAVTFELSKNPSLTTNYGAIQKHLNNYPKKNIKTVRKIIINIRKEKLPDPNEIGNAGSFFKNPIVNRVKFENIYDNFPAMPYYELSQDTVKIPAGWMIEKCGWKGKRIGNAGVYNKQALILVNYGNATGQEIYDLSQQIKADVKKQFGITLEEEVNII
ncbi:MAG: UDP-N-acetylmuramate dehydrogenase [Candidatus Marinimicrobia bacterium]|nr:UDP-N-acetylmuramate dehydrogenase [Candidatus Neomarinimicrobiota bacterium]